MHGREICGIARSRPDNPCISALAIKLFPALRSNSPRRRLWLAGSAMALFLVTLLIGNLCIPRDKAVTREMIGHDFLAFYTAGALVRQGQYRNLYNLDVVRDAEQSTAHTAGLEVGKSFGPWWNPPFYALPFAPLSRLPYPVALSVWRCINLAALAGALALLAWMVASSAGAGPGVWGLVPLLVLVSMPFVQALSHGQNTFTSLLLLAATVAVWRRGRGVWAGLIGGLLFYKPQLAAVVAAAMVIDLGPAALVGLGVSGLSLLVLTVLILPESLSDYVHQLPANVHWMQVEHAYLWERHVTLKAFWRLLLQGRAAGEASAMVQALTDASLAALVGLFAVVWWRLKRRREIACEDRRVQRDRWIAATICAMPLLMPFYFDYDLLLLTIPATLYAAERVRRPELHRHADTWLSSAWIVLFFWLFVNPAVGMHTHVNVTVILLSSVATMHVLRAGRREGSLAVGSADAHVGVAALQRQAA
jgi:hypothetical protein